MSGDGGTSEDRTLRKEDSGIVNGEGSDPDGLRTSSGRVNIPELVILHEKSLMQK